MTITFYYGNKKISKAKAIELAGKDRLHEMIQEAKESFFDDPLEQSSYMVQGGFLTIEIA